MVSFNPIGIVLVVYGVLALIWPYRVARFHQRWRAIGSTRSLSDVEPASWYMTLTRVIGLVVIAFGLNVLLGVL